MNWEYCQWKNRAIHSLNTGPERLRFMLNVKGNDGSLYLARAGSGIPVAKMLVGP